MSAGKATRAASTRVEKISWLIDYCHGSFQRTLSKNELRTLAQAMIQARLYSLTTNASDIVSGLPKLLREARGLT